MESPQTVHIPLVCPGAPRKVRPQSTIENIQLTNKNVRRQLNFN
jgi:hypothetical protein